MFFNSFLFPVVAGIRFAKTVLRISDSEDDRMPPRAVNRILTAIFTGECHIAGRVAMPFGVSLLMIARKAGP